MIQEENHIERRFWVVCSILSCCWWFYFYTDSLTAWLKCRFYGSIVHFVSTMIYTTPCTCFDMPVWDLGEIQIFHQLFNHLHNTPQKSKLVNYVMSNYTYLKLQIVNFGDGTCRDPLASHRMGPSWKKCQASLPVMVLVCLCVGGVIVLEMPGLLTTNNT